MTDFNIAAALTEQTARANARTNASKSASAEPAQEKFNAVMARAHERHAEHKPAKQTAADNTQRAQPNQAPAKANVKQANNESGTDDTALDETDGTNRDAAAAAAEEQEQAQAIVALLPNAPANGNATQTAMAALIGAANPQSAETALAAEASAIAENATDTAGTDLPLVSADALLKAKVSGNAATSLATTAVDGAASALQTTADAFDQSKRQRAADKAATNEHSVSKPLLRDLDQDETLKSGAALRAETTGAALAAQSTQRDISATQQLSPLTAPPSAVRIDAALAPMQPSYTVAHAGIATPVQAPGFAQDFASRIVTFTSQRVHSAEIDLNPAELGPVSVSIELRGQEASLAFGANAAATRAAIEDALPRLREMLAAQGMQLTQSSVGEHPRQQSNQGTDGGNSGRQQGNGAGRSSAADGQRIESATPAAAASRGRYLIDVRV